MYNADDPVNSSYGRAGLALLYGYRNNRFSFGVGPAFEYLNEKKDDVTDTEDYFESGARMDLDYLAANTFWSIESTSGYRNLKNESDLLTDFTFERLNLLADFRIWSLLNLNVLFSAEWEWHAHREENSELYLLSADLSYTW